MVLSRIKKWFSLFIVASGIGLSFGSSSCYRPENVTPTITILRDGYTNVDASNSILNNKYMPNADKYTYYVLKLPGSDVPNYLFSVVNSISDYQDISFELANQKVKGKYKIVMLNNNKISLMPASDSNPTITFSSEDGKQSKTITVQMGSIVKKIQNPGFVVQGHMSVDKSKDGTNPRVAFMNHPKYAIHGYAIVPAGELFTKIANSNDKSVSLFVVDTNNIKAIFKDNLHGGMFYVVHEAYKIPNNDNLVLYASDRRNKSYEIITYIVHSPRVDVEKYMCFKEGVPFYIYREGHEGDVDHRIKITYTDFVVLDHFVSKSQKRFEKYGDLEIVNEFYQDRIPGVIRLVATIPASVSDNPRTVSWEFKAAGLGIGFDSIHTIVIPIGADYTNMCNQNSKTDSDDVELNGSDSGAEDSNKPDTGDMSFNINMKNMSNAKRSDRLKQLIQGFGRRMSSVQVHMRKVVNKIRKKQIV